MTICIQLYFLSSLVETSKAKQNTCNIDHNKGDRLLRSKLFPEILQCFVTGLVSQAVAMIVEQIATTRLVQGSLASQTHFCGMGLACETRYKAVADNIMLEKASYSTSIAQVYMIHPPKSSGKYLI